MNGELKKGLDKLRKTGSDKELAECMSKPTDLDKIKYLRRMGYLSIPREIVPYAKRAQKRWGKLARGLKGINK